MSKMCRAAIVAMASSLALALAADHDPAQVLENVTAKVRERTARLPNYTCVETVKRDYYQPLVARLARPCADVLQQRRHPPLDMVLRLVLTDRLRLDVTLTNKGEIYSWVGASKFEAGIDQVVHLGPIGTGSFGALLAVIFQQHLNAFHFERGLLADGRNLMEYSFGVAQKDSRYEVKTPDSWVNTAYAGTFQADPETNEVVRVALETVDLAPATESWEIATAMDFGLVQIGDGQFLLPRQGRQRYVDATGGEVENTTTFGSCREFRGESTVTFGDGPDSIGGSGQKTSAPSSLPAGLPFTVELTAPISTDTAAGGDSFSGRLVSALRDGKDKIIAPAHSVVEGRLLRVESQRVDPLGSVVVLQPRKLEIGGVQVALTANRAAERVPAGSRGRVPVVLPYPWERNAAAFPLLGEHAMMKAGFRSKWVTVAAGEAVHGSK
jgi:hypothetical protein